MSVDMPSAASDPAALFRRFFLNSHDESIAEYRTLVARVAESIVEQITRQSQPYNGRHPDALLDAARAVRYFPNEGKPLAEVMEMTHSLVIRHSLSVYHPLCLAHLHCPTFIASLLAEMIISAFNQSMDSFDQAPVATMIEQALCEQLCAVYGFDSNSDAVFTGGGTMSNFMGLLLARDHYAQQFSGWSIRRQGLPAEAARFRILCSEYAHFTVVQSASILGLGECAVVKIKNGGFSEAVDALQAKIDELKNEGLLPICYVSTAGTTDFGAIGDLSALADCAHANGLWFHVDAAYGGGLIFSERHKHKLQGIDKADSVTVDFHKLFYQPISCGVFIVKDKRSFEYIRLHADYLNPESNESQGILDLVYKSIQTTRRFDALKPFISLQHVGVRKLGEMIDYTIELASKINTLIEADDRFELAQHGILNTVLFRYVPKTDLDADAVDAINNRIKTGLLLSGEAIIGQTQINGRAFLKFTLLNPMTGIDEIKGLLDMIKTAGSKLEFDGAGTAQPS